MLKIRGVRGRTCDIPAVTPLWHPMYNFASLISMTSQRYTSLLAVLVLTSCTPSPIEPVAVSTSSEVQENTASQAAFPYVPPGEEVTSPDELPFTYDAGSLELKLYRFSEPAAGHFEYLVENSTDLSCAPKRPAGYYQKLAKTFSGSVKTTYAFQAQSGPHRGSVFQLVLLPNLQKYNDVKKVGEDFYACSVGAMTGFKVSPKWLLFEFSCGGVDEGCGVIGEQIKPTVVMRT